MMTTDFLTSVERALPYSKYFFRDMPSLTTTQLKALENGSLSESDMLPIENRRQLLNGIYTDGDIGFGIFENGTGYVANITSMPNVTPEMFYWWFAWHALEDLRYKIWFPEKHYFARTQNLELALNETRPMEERIWGTTHLICEDVVAGAEEVFLDFLFPEEMGYDELKLGSDKASAMVCANGHTRVPGQGLNCVMTHLLRKGPSGYELRSQFWIGYQIIDGKVFRVIPDETQIPLDAAKSLFKHCCIEFANLREILPSLYNDNKDKSFL